MKWRLWLGKRNGRRLSERETNSFGLRRPVCMHDMALGFMRSSKRCTDIPICRRNRKAHFTTLIRLSHCFSAIWNVYAHQSVSDKVLYKGASKERFTVKRVLILTALGGFR